MENDEKTLDTQEETQESETAVAEEAPAEDVPVEETPEAKLAKANAEAAKWRRLFEKQQKPSEKKEPQSASPASIEETVLLAQGFPEDLMKDLKTVAKVKNISILKAQTDPVFVAIKDTFEKAKKQKDASLPASRGSGGVQVQKTFSTPNLSRDEHKKMVSDLS